jgi:hypothetical protein
MTRDQSRHLGRARWPISSKADASMHAVPPVGWWFRIVPDGPGVGRYHQIRSAAQLRSSSDGEELEVVESVCRQAFTLDRVIDIAPPDDPVLRQYFGDLYASCGICLDERPSRPNREARILQDARRARDRGERGEWEILSVRCVEASASEQSRPPSIERRAGPILLIRRWTARTIQLQSPSAGSPLVDWSIDRFRLASGRLTRLRSGHLTPRKT